MLRHIWISAIAIIVSVSTVTAEPSAPRELINLIAFRDGRAAQWATVPANSDDIAMQLSLLSPAPSAAHTRPALRAPKPRHKAGGLGGVE